MFQIPHHVKSHINSLVIYWKCKESISSSLAVSEPFPTTWTVLGIVTLLTIDPSSLVTYGPQGFPNYTALYLLSTVRSNPNRWTMGHPSGGPLVAYLLFLILDCPPWLVCRTHLWIKQWRNSWMLEKGSRGRREDNVWIIDWIAPD